MNKPIHYILILFLIVAASCSITKYVPQDRYLLDRATITTDSRRLDAKSLEPYLKQKSNFRIFTFFRTQLRFYSLSGRDSSKWINRFLRKIGEPPVILDEELVERSRQDLQKAVLNQGYMNVTVDTIIDRRKKRANVTYLVNAGQPYKIRNYSLDIGNDQILQIVANDSTNSLLKSGVNFDRSLLDKERLRIVTLLRRNGFFAIAKERIAYFADSTLNSNQVDLTLRLFPNNSRAFQTKLSPEECQYLVKNVYIITEYDPTKLVENQTLSHDTLSYKGYRLIYGERRWIRPEVLRSSCYIMPNQLFDERTIDLTYSSFGRLKAVKYVNIRFEPVVENDSCYLNCFLMLSDSKTQSLTSEIEGTNSSGDFGAAASLTYQHRNIFNGSETFSAKVRGAYERLTIDGLNSSVTEVGGELGLSFPKFVFPFINYDTRRRVRAISELIGSYNFQQRPEYSRVISGSTWRYKWSNSTATQRHSVDLIDLNYVYLPWKDPAFSERLNADNPLLKYSYENHLIMRTGYSLYLSNQGTASGRKNPYSLRFSIETAGNFLSLVSKLTQASKVNGFYEFMGISYSQYAKAEIDFSRSHLIDENNSFAWHANTGVAVPYGNTAVLPFEKRYFAGGANSVRGWSVRSLGPGIFKPNDGVTDFVSHSGDLKLDLSMELRSKLFWKLESALFVDAGNIWTIRNYSDQSGGLFRFESFYKEIALAYGLGVRLNFDYFVLRLDMGIKAYDPAQETALRWRFSHLSSSEMAWHIAIGYPF